MVPLTLALLGTATAAPGDSSPTGAAAAGPAGSPEVESRVKDIIETGGLRFRDLNDNARLDPYENWRLPTTTRAADLLSRMTLQEKAGMMLISSHYMGTSDNCGDGGGTALLCEHDRWEETNSWDGKPYDKPVLSASGATKGIGERHLRHLIVRDDREAKDLARWTNALQEIAEGSRLGIPVVMASNPRNHLNSDRTFGVSEAGGKFSTWPGELGLAATRDPGLVREFSRIAAREWRAAGIHKGYMYMADTATEPRWTRASDTFGEEPQLAADMIKSIVEGFQGDELSAESVSLTTKHFPGGGAREDGRDPHFSWGKFQPYPNEGSLQRYHLPPFQAAVDAGTTSIMPYYSAPRNEGSAPQLPKKLWQSEDQQFEEVGFAYNGAFLQGLLRDEMGFQGYVNSDTGITTAQPWGVEELSSTERYAKAIKAGTNIFSGEADPKDLIRAVEEGLVKESEIDRSVSFLLTEMFDLGLFEDPYNDPRRAQTIADDPASQAKADAAHRKSVAMLRNEGQALPLTDQDTEDVRLYVEVFTRDDAAEQTAGLAKRIAEHDPSITLVDRPEEATHAFLWARPNLNLRDDTETSRLSVELDEKTGIDVARIRQIQEEVDTNIVGINMTNPWLVGEIDQDADATLATFDVTPEAVVDVIRGRTDPTGKLPVTVPASLDAVDGNAPDVPGYDEGPGYAYVNGSGDAYTFGFGLGYRR
ncbi:glycoside hydrolase family 3 protein [Streptomyces cavernicola]|uniref:beta-glucosidase n=1 Tax=Streptomyces cavernicola TaxID=3043613 RepID=A0ABT6S5W2_9ACTN|nr:glycoside hydrolase family 3 N-terminal domain-containing protein [Streptomyces sp. B-S-A6]MDI3403410.1 glycoside hydrolase family 3 N-terminal domain-containing protein [Streptomyces sp. B-S-A6]